MRRALVSPLLLLPLLTLSTIAVAQTAEPRYARAYLHDKGVPFRFLMPGDPLYQTATEWLSPRALARRAKVLAASRLVSTDDLPVDSGYLLQIERAGVSVEQTSRWFNTAMLRGDSAALAAVGRLPFVDSLEWIATVIPGGAAPGLLPRLSLGHAALENSAYVSCITERYGFSAFQNRFMGLDEAHRIGVAGDGVLVGVLDAGFDWRSHRALVESRVVGEYDFIYRDSLTADEPSDSAANDSQESHGTLVLSVMAAWWPDTLIGGAPRSEYMLAKTEDLRFERHVEEDNFVAGLEWLEAQGVDVTNTSLGYTEFDAPEAPHTREELNGHSIISSRAMNRATELGVFNVAAAGNEGYPWDFVLVSTPGEADSAIAAAAVDSLGRVAQFSSRGRNGRGLKPDLAGLGVGTWGAMSIGPTRLMRAQGTSLASPMVASVAAVVLSAAPELTPSQLREVLVRSASQFAQPDTAFGYGIASASGALALLSVHRPIVGVPAVSLNRGALEVAAWLMHRDAATYESRPTLSRLDSLLILTVSNGRTGISISSVAVHPREGIVRWAIDASSLALRAGDSLIVSIGERASQRQLRRSAFQFDGQNVRSTSTLCSEPGLATLDGDRTILAWPNPTNRFAQLSFRLDVPAAVTLTLHNAIGEEVARIHDGEVLAAGPHAPFVDFLGLPSGSYYPLLRAGEVVWTGGLIYLP